ncbi:MULTISPECIES: hypothetical protein [unclassified Bradyrhizobium]
MTTIILTGIITGIVIVIASSSTTTSSTSISIAIGAAGIAGSPAAAGDLISIKKWFAITAKPLPVLTAKSSRR